MTTRDPFSQAERLIWFILESHPGFADRVLPGNRIKLFGGGDAPAIKAALQVADLPEVYVQPFDGTGEVNRNSSGEGFTQQFQIRVSTGKIPTEGDGYRTLQAGLNAMKWEIIKAFGHWADVFAGFPGVRRVDLIPFVDQSGDETERSRGWVMLATVAVTMQWSNMEIERWL